MYRLSLGLMLASGCAPESTVHPLPTVFAEDSEEAACLLDFANDPEADAVLVDLGVKVRSAYVNETKLGAIGRK